MTDIRISVRNTSAEGGTFLTPFWFSAHDKGFDVFDVGSAASAGLEALAEDGNFSVINGEVTSFDEDAQVGAVFGQTAPPIRPGEYTSATVSIDGSQNAYLSLAAMLLPSNDAFVATEEAIKLFDADGNFLGAQSISFEGSDVLDAGTEVNTEQDAAFINQTGPNTGIDENGVVTAHEGFLPEGEGAILGGLNAFGERIDAEAADFTREGAGIADIHINTVRSLDGSDTGEVLQGNASDDIVHAGGGDDRIIGRGGWDEIYGGAGNDTISGGAGDDMIDGGADDDFLSGNAGNDVVFGQSGSDRIVAGAGDDVVSGGDGADAIDGNAGDDVLFGDAGDDGISGGAGNDTITGGIGDDQLRGGDGEDTFVFFIGDGNDAIRDFDVTEDVLALGSDLATDFETVLGAAEQGNGRTVLNFGDGDSIVLNGVDVTELTADTFSFVELF